MKGQEQKSLPPPSPDEGRAVELGTLPPASLRELLDAVTLAERRRHMTAEELGIPLHVCPHFELRSLCSFLLVPPGVRSGGIADSGFGEIVREGGHVVVRDEATAYHLIGWGCCAPFGWTPDASAVRRCADEALGLLTRGNAETVDQMSEQTKAQVGRIAALLGGK